jgi:hypothetical protein
MIRDPIWTKGSASAFTSAGNNITISWALGSAYVLHDSRSLNHFNPAPIRNGVPVVSTIDTSVLLTMATDASGGNYFDNTSKITRVDLIYWDNNSREKKRIIHIGENFEGRTSWSPTSSPGVWRATEARLRDSDGAELFIERDILGDLQDITLT